MCSISKIFSLVILLLVSSSVYAQLDVRIKSVNQSICTGATLSLQDSVVSGSPTSFEWVSTAAAFSNANSRNTDATFSTSGYVVLKTTSGMDTYLDSMYITVNSLPKVNLLSFPQRIYCENNRPIKMSASPKNGVFTCTDLSSLVGGDTFDPSRVTAFGEDITIYYFYTEPTTGCSNVDSTRTRVIAEPRLSLLAQDSICYMNGVSSVIVPIKIIARNSGSTILLPTTYYNNRDRIEIGLTQDTVGEVIVKPIGRDTFRIAAIASGLGPCLDYTTFIDIILYQDTNCLSNVTNQMVSNLHIYPNPSNGMFTIENGKDYTVSICDMQGRAVNYRPIGNDQIRIGAKGLYIITLRDKNTGVYLNKKLVVE